MLEGFSLGSYLLLVDYTGRLVPRRQGHDLAELSGIFDRLGSSAESWWARIEKLSKGRLLGRFFAASRERLARGRDAAWACIIWQTWADARRDRSTCRFVPIRLLRPPDDEKPSFRSVG